MRKKRINKLLFIVISLVLFGSGFPAIASEVTGNLTTGIGSSMDGVVIVLPTASPVAGTYTSAQSVALSASGASSIHYTADGTVPTCSTGTVYSGAISVGSSQTIKAISCYPNNNSSTVASFAYTINIPVTTSTSSGGGGGGGSYYAPTVTTTGTLSAEAQKVDTNKDNKVDVLEFVSLMANWGKIGTSITADFNSDGKVDVLDFVMLMVNWTK